MRWLKRWLICPVPFKPGAFMPSRFRLFPSACASAPNGSTQAHATRVSRWRRFSARAFTDAASLRDFWRYEVQLTQPPYPEPAGRKSDMEIVEPQLGELFYKLQSRPLEIVESLPGVPAPKQETPRPSHPAERRSRANTSSSVEPESGSASYSARRRSSSSLCHWVRGRASGAAEMLSQIASTKRTCSVTGKARISATSSCFIIHNLPLSYQAR